MTVTSNIGFPGMKGARCGHDLLSGQRSKEKCLLTIMMVAREYVY